jgi:hypothetical protein
VFNYVVALDGPSEFPPNASMGMGIGTVSYDNVAHTLQLQVVFSGLTGNTTASHIHAPTAFPFALTNNAGVATTTPSFAGFPTGVTSGAFSNTLDLTLASSYNPSFVTANGGTTASAEAALTAAIAQGRAYWNIHSSAFPGGEIRGFLTPEPPVIHSVAANPSVLWPPNHKLVPVTITVDASGGSGDIACRIVAVTSDEPVSAARRGPDWEITGPLTVNLRAERSGRGDGRVYTITVECEDEAGVTVQQEITVTVPKSPSRFHAVTDRPQAARR